ncbi:MAG: 50S ribosomal protein L17 [Patescibacteria group bacterium]
MRHKKKKLTLDRKRGPRTAMIRSLARGLILHGAIVTTDARARAVRSFAERCITVGKTPSLHNRRLLIQRTHSADLAQKVIDVSKKYQDRKGGYTRLLRLEPREGDRARMIRVELVT